MSITSRAKNKLIADTNEAFSKIGAMPVKPATNKEPIAYEYFIANHLAKLAEGRREVAKKSAVDAGILPDVDDPKNQREPGTDEFVYQDNLVIITLNVSKPRIQVDMKELTKQLLAAKVKPDVVDAAIKAASKPTRAGHKFSALLNSNGE
jgi:hypothetical protein